MSEPATMILNRRQLLWFSLAYIVFIIYGSLVPLTFQELPWDEAVDRFQKVLAEPIVVQHRSDWLANILLFIPLGFVSMGAFSVDQKRLNAAPIGLLLPFFTLLSGSIEFTQIWFPPRYTSINDIAAESLGGALGIACWFVCGQKWVDYLRQFWEIHADRNWALRLIPGYFILLVFVQCMPFDLTLSPAMIWKKYKDHKVLPIPFSTFLDEPWKFVEKGLKNGAFFFPIGLMLPGLPRRFVSGRYAFAKVLTIALVMAGTIEFMQLFVNSRYCSSTDIITGTFAIIFGWMLVEPRWLGRSESLFLSVRVRAALLLFWVASLIFINWQPFDFVHDRGFLVERWQGQSWIPFFDYYSGNYLQAFMDILEKTLLFVPVGFFMQTMRNDPWWQFVVIAVAILFAISIEAGQFFLRQHHPGISDIIIEPAGAWLGCLAASRWQQLIKQNKYNDAVPSIVTPYRNHRQ